MTDGRGWRGSEGLGRLAAGVGESLNSLGASQVAGGERAARLDGVAPLPFELPPVSAARHGPSPYNNGEHAGEVGDRGDLGSDAGLGRPDDLVFTTIVGNPITHRRLLRAVKRAAKIAELGRLVPKDLRTSFVTAAVHSGLAPVEITTMTGQSAPVVERFYAKPIRTAQQEKENVDRMITSGF